MYDIKKLEELITARNVPLLKQFMLDHGLVLSHNRIVPKRDMAELQKQALFWNQRQLAKKIILNATYGALLNEMMRLFDQRIGQSTTLSGRLMAKHMAATINEIIIQIRDHMGDAIIYGDTDSCYFSAYEVLKNRPEYKNFDWSRENVIEMYDLIADEINSIFPEFMQRTFNTSVKRSAIIGASRELVASKGLFIKKKKYAVLIYDLEGKRQDIDGKPGKLKAMGLDLKRADTPRIMQKFLESLLMDLLTDQPKDTMYQNIRDFRHAFKARPGWEKGSPKKVANLAEFASKHSNAKNKSLLTPLKSGEKLRINTPGHVTASLNWNTLCDLFDDRHATRITDSARIIVCKLLNNIYDMSSIAFPIDETHLPQWFRELPFDHAAMETAIIDKKLGNLVGVLDWDLTDTKEKAGEEFFISENNIRSLTTEQRELLICLLTASLDVAKVITSVLALPVQDGYQLIDAHNLTDEIGDLVGIADRLAELDMISIDELDERIERKTRHLENYLLYKNDMMKVTG